MREAQGDGKISRAPLGLGDRAEILTVVTPMLVRPLGWEVIQPFSSLALARRSWNLGNVLLDWVSQNEPGLVLVLFLLEALSLPMLSESL